MPSALKQLEQRITASLSPATYCKLVNATNRLRGWQHQVEPNADPGLYDVRVNDEQITICRRARHRRYKRGVTKRATALAEEYGLTAIEKTEGGVLIDCGANVGELGYWAATRGLTYHAFEPEPLEATCVDLNRFNGAPTTRRNALWNKAETLTFYSAPNTADSSAFKIREATGQFTVQAVRLDDVDIPLSTTGPNILKLEAEGAEPEILDGAPETLKRLHYIAVDCGYERGEEKRHTFIDVCDRLLPLGFRPVEANLRRVTILFRNDALT